MHLRLATPSDAAALLEIYRPYIATPVSFELTPPDETEFAARIADYGSQYPYLVCEGGGRALGYAYAHRAQERAAYGWNAELSIYLRPEATGRGLGRRLYTALMELLRLQGVKTAYGVVTVPNAASEGLHEALGFRRIGVFYNTGYKCGAWRDVAWFEKALAPYDPEPAPLQPFRTLPPETVQAVLQRASDAPQL